MHATSSERPSWLPVLEELGPGVVDMNVDAASPQCAGQGVAIARPRAARPAAAGTLDIIVVEDEPVLARFIKIYLSLDGARIRLAGNGAEASAELCKRPVPDLILLDAMLPDADGFDILRWMRAQAVLKDVPVIMLTGKATRESVLEGIGSGADGYVTKPFLPESLIRVARACLGLAQARGDADPWAHSLACQPPLPPAPQTNDRANPTARIA